MHKLVLASAAAVASLLGCAGHLASRPAAIGALDVRPSVLRPDAFAGVQLHVYLNPAISDAKGVLEAVGLRNIELSHLRASVARGLAEGLRDAFGTVVLVNDANVEGLLLRVDEITPQHVKTGNVPIGTGTVVYEMRFDVRYRAALLKGGDTLASAAGTVEGRDMSWKVRDQPLMLQHALEDTLRDVARRLFADEAMVRASGGRSTGVAIRPTRGPQSSVAVMPLQPAGGVSRSATQVLDQLLIVAVDHGPLAAISTGDVNAMLGHERLLDAMGCSDTQCAAEIGGALGVQYLLTGNVSKLGSKVIVTLHLLNTDTAASAARGQAAVKDDEDLYQQAVEEAVRNLMAAARVR